MNKAKGEGQKRENAPRRPAPVGNRSGGVYRRISFSDRGDEASFCRHPALPAGIFRGVALHPFSAGARHSALPGRKTGMQSPLSGYPAGLFAEPSVLPEGGQAAPSLQTAER